MYVICIYYVRLANKVGIWLMMLLSNLIFWDNTVFRGLVFRMEWIRYL